MTERCSVEPWPGSGGCRTGPDAGVVVIRAYPLIHRSGGTGSVGAHRTWPVAIRKEVGARGVLASFVHVLVTGPSRLAALNGLDAEPTPAGPHIKVAADGVIAARLETSPENTLRLSSLAIVGADPSGIERRAGSESLVIGEEALIWVARLRRSTTGEWSWTGVWIRPGGLGARLATLAATSDTNLATGARVGVRLDVTVHAVATEADQAGVRPDAPGGRAVEAWRRRPRRYRRHRTHAGAALAGG